MTWRLLEIGLYNRKTGELRRLPLRPHGLNIITGDSHTGKSAVIDIINYGLMSEHCSIASGIIRENVGHVALLLQGDESRMLIVRPVPSHGKATVSSVHVATGASIELPSKPPETTWNRETARDALSDFTGIEGVNLIDNSTTVDPLMQYEVTLRHVVPFLFQPQEVIANRHLAFPNTTDLFQRRATIDALPYFLGLHGPEIFRDRTRLRNLRMEIRRQGKRGEERRLLGTNGYQRGMTLLTEAQALNVIEAEPPKDLQALMILLRGTLASSFKGFSHLKQPPQLEALREQEKAAATRASRTRRELERLDGFDRAHNAFDNAVQVNVAKLGVTDLIGEPTSDFQCPLCHSHQANAKGIQQDLELALTSLSESRRHPHRVMRFVEQRKQILGRELEVSEQQLRQVRQKIKSTYELLEARVDDLQRASAIERLRGRIEEYLQSMTLGQEAGPDSSALEKEITELNARVGDAVLADALKSAEREIAEDMQTICSQLDVEFTGASKVDLEELVIRVAQTPEAEATTPLSDIGSGANWVSYHVGASLAMHRWFVRRECKVPRLLVFDQPSQVYFPMEESPQNAGDDDAMLPPNVDVQRVKQLYRVLHEESKGPDAPQIIVMDHAKFKEAWFQDSIIADWRKDQKLVPMSWLEPMP